MNSKEKKDIEEQKQPRNKKCFRIYDNQRYIDNEIITSTMPKPKLPPIHSFESYSVEEYEPITAPLNIPSGMR